jgi:protein involved in polysaccharide export with SLBB domain
LGKLILEHDATQNLSLEQGDVVTVFSQDDLRPPIALQTKYVQLEGEIVHSGVYSVRPGETLRQLVARAGGLTPQAYLYGTNFTRNSTRHIEQHVFNDYVDQLEQDLARTSLAASGAASAQSTDAAAHQIQSANQLLVSKLRHVQPTGRIVFPLKPTSNNADELPDIALEDGDRMIGPVHPATVQVIGAVNYQNAFLYHDDMSAADYLKLAGGLSRNADRSKAFILRANGSVSPLNSAQSVFAASFTHQKLYPGDTLVMPEKGVRRGAMREVLNWAQLFSQLSLASAAISVLQ